MPRTLGCTEVLLTLLVATLAACRPASGTARAWSTLVSDWVESDHQANPTLAERNPDRSEAGLAAEIRRLKDWRARVVSVDAAGLGESANHERQILLAVISRRLYWDEHNAGMELRRRGTDHSPMGAEQFAAMLLATDGVDTPVPRLQADAVIEQQRDKSALQQACARLSPARTLKQCLAASASMPPEAMPAFPVAAALGALEGSPSLSQGWVLYSEQLARDLGEQEGSAATHVQQLRNALIHDLQLRAAIGLHAQGMTLAETKQLFLDSGVLTDAQALQQAEQVAREPAVIYPGLGKLLIHSLRAEWCANRGGDQDRNCWRQFHQAFTPCRNLPFPAARASLLAAGVHL